MRWGMTIDLQSCTGCYGCVIACKQEHSTPSGIHFRRMMFEEVGEYPTAKRLHAPVQCNHCAEPPCVPVCPTKATYKRQDGLVLVDQDTCIGCNYCLIACPYEHRHFVGGEVGEFELGHFGEAPTPHESSGGEAGQGAQSNVRRLLYRPTSIGRRRPSDREVTPACVNTCPSEAMVFGDLDDLNSRINKLIKERNGFGLLPEAGTQPSIFYLPDARPNK